MARILCAWLNQHHPLPHCQVLPFSILSCAQICHTLILSMYSSEIQQQQTKSKVLAGFPNIFKWVVPYMLCSLHSCMAAKMKKAKYNQTLKCWMCNCFLTPLCSENLDLPSCVLHCIVCMFLNFEWSCLRLSRACWGNGQISVRLSVYAEDVEDIRDKRDEDHHHGNHGHHHHDLEK